MTPLSKLHPGAGFRRERSGWAYIKTTQTPSVNEFTVLHLASGRLVRLHRDVLVYEGEVEVKSS